MDWCAGLAFRPGMEAAVSALAEGRLTLLAVVKMTSRRAHMCASALGCFSRATAAVSSGTSCSSCSVSSWRAWSSRVALASASCMGDSGSRPWMGRHAG